MFAVRSASNIVFEQDRFQEPARIARHRRSAPHHPDTLIGAYSNLCLAASSGHVVAMASDGSRFPRPSLYSFVMQHPWGTIANAI
jgi:hypothetical protein